MGVDRVGWGLLGLLLAAVVGLALFGAKGRVPAPGEETTNWLAAHSLAADGDLVLAEVDRARFRAAFGREAAGVETERGGSRLVAPPLVTRLWQLALAVGGERGPFLLHALALALAALAACATLSRFDPRGAPWAVAVLLFGSVAFAAVFRYRPEILVFAVVVAAGWLVWGRGDRGARAGAPAEIYAGDGLMTATAWPWWVAAFLVGTAAIRHPAYVLLALPIWRDRPWVGGGRSRSKARAGWWASPLFFAALVAPVALASFAFGPHWDPPASLFDLTLTAWNSFDFLLGRNAGLLVSYLPAVALFVTAPKAGGRALLPWAVVAAVLAQLLLSPFDWAGDLHGFGNLWFLPLYGGLLFAAGEAFDRRLSALLALAVLPALAPLWWAPLSDAARAPSWMEPWTVGVRARLPFETALREAPASSELVRGGVRLRSEDAGLALVDQRFEIGRDGAALLVESERPLASLRLDFSADAPGSLVVEGGRAGSTTFRPNGEVAFEVELGKPERRHPLWWSRSPVSIYRLRLALPGAGRMALQGDSPSARPVSFDLGLARVRGAETEHP